MAVVRFAKKTRAKWRSGARSDPEAARVAQALRLAIAGQVAEVDPEGGVACATCVGA